MVEIRRDYCVNIFPGGNNFSCSFYNVPSPDPLPSPPHPPHPFPPKVANRSFLSTRSGAACCLFQPSFHPPPPDFLRSSVHAGAPPPPLPPPLNAQPLQRESRDTDTFLSISRRRCVCMGRQQRVLVVRPRAAAAAGAVLLRVSR